MRFISFIYVSLLGNNKYEKLNFTSMTHSMTCVQSNTKDEGVNLYGNIIIKKIKLNHNILVT